MTWSPSLARLLVLALTVLVSVGLTLSEALGRLDRMGYDLLHGLLARPIDPDIVILAIDEPSLRELGAWPWPRQVHARALRNLADLDVAAVGVDILFAEPQRAEPQADQALAEALALTPSVLPVAPGLGVAGRPIQEILPLPELAAAAAALGHVDYELDRDGICRSLYLYGGLGDPHWPAFPLALAQLRRPQADLWQRLPARDQVSGQHWLRAGKTLIPFNGPPDSYPRISYVDLYRQRVDPVLLRGKLVLIGATAAGLGDELAVPVSRDHNRMPGVELNAHVLDALLHDRLIAEATPRLKLILTLLFVTVSLYLMLRLPERWGSAALAGGLVGILLTHLALLLLLKLWWPPTVALLLLILSYVLWNRSRLRRAFRAIDHAHTHDPVTGLANKQLLRERLGRLLTAAGGQRQPFELLVIGLRGIAELGDRVGQDRLDQIRRAIAGRMQDGFGQEALVVSLATADFALSCCPHEDATRMLSRHNRLRELFQAPFEVAGNQYLIRAAIGACLWPEHGDDPQALLDNAYVAMNQAKRSGLPEVCLFSREVRGNLQRQYQLEAALDRALADDELRLFVQPQTATGDGRLAGVEVLLRWQSRDFGLVPPLQFIPIAENNGAIVPIGDWVLRQSCHLLQAWRQRWQSPPRMAVNVSAMQFARDEFVDEVERILATTGVPAGLLELELTESLLMHNLSSAIDTLKRLKALGVTLAIDDFGTGYSSLSYLQHFQVDRLKIDRSFVRGVPHDPVSVHLLQSIMTMAQGLGLTVIAEGIETLEQYDFLKGVGCDEVQGFLFSRPLPVARFEAEWMTGRGETAAGTLLPGGRSDGLRGA